MPTAQWRTLPVWRKGLDDEALLLLGEVTTKATGYMGNPFGAAYVRVDATYVDVACGRPAGG